MDFLTSCKNIVNKICVIGLALFGISGVGYAQEKLRIPEEFEEFKVVKYKFQSNGPTLMFSDSPEFVYHNGVLYRDNVDGNLRIFFHHLNDVKKTTKKLAVVLKNRHSLSPINYKITRLGMAGKTNDWLLDGKLAQEKYFGKQPKLKQGKIGFGRSVEIISGKGTNLKHYELWTGIVDLELDKKTEVSVLMCDEKDNIENFNETAPLLPLDEHPLRGTFANANWIYNVSTKIKGDEVYMLKLGSADEGEGYLKGIDATTGLSAEDYGNYGVLYELHFDVVGKQPVWFVLNPIGGPFNGYGVLEFEGKSKLIGMPELDVATENNVEDARVMAELMPGKYKFTWSPAGTASLPLRFFWMPKNKLLEHPKKNKYFADYSKTYYQE